MMTIDTSSFIGAEEKKAILALWNNEYPVSLRLAGEAALEAYFASLKPLSHLLLREADSSTKGWLFLFERMEEVWFAMILAREAQGCGYGRMLLQQAGAVTPVLHGWAIDHDGYTKADGSPYPSPLGFYRRLGFEVLDERMEQPFSAVKIRWRPGAGRLPVFNTSPV